MRSSHSGTRAHSLAGHNKKGNEADGGKGVGEPGNGTCTCGLAILKLVVSHLLTSKKSLLAYSIF